MTGRATQGVSGYWTTSTNRNTTDSQTLPYANLRTQHCRCKIEILVFFDETPKSQEVKRRNHYNQRGV